MGGSGRGGRSPASRRGVWWPQRHPHQMQDSHPCRTERKTEKMSPSGPGTPVEASPSPRTSPRDGDCDCDGGVDGDRTARAWSTDLRARVGAQCGRPPPLAGHTLSFQCFSRPSRSDPPHRASLLSSQDRCRRSGCTRGEQTCRDGTQPSLCNEVGSAVVNGGCHVSYLPRARGCPPVVRQYPPGVKEGGSCRR